MFKELDVVRLKKDDATLGIMSSYIGTIVDVHNNGEAYTVEFFDNDNETIMEGLYAEFSPDELQLAAE